MQTLAEKKAESIWKQIEKSVIVAIKKHLLRHYPSEILHKYKSKLNYLVSKYATHLPQHVAQSESDDLSNIARIELFETIKNWDPDKNKDIWPLAYSRITGAMKDHIRYITKSDPSRMYEWITNAAYLYLTVNKHQDFEHKIDTGIQLKDAMKMLSPTERKVVIEHSKHDRTFKEIGDEIKISESQVARIYKKSIGKLKKIVSPSKAQLKKISPHKMPQIDNFPQ